MKARITLISVFKLVITAHCVHGRGVSSYAAPPASSAGAAAPLVVLAVGTRPLPRSPARPLFTKSGEAKYKAADYSRRAR